MADGTGNDNDTKAREERLAAKLRENLRRRKRQSRALDARNGTSPPKNTGLPESTGLSKSEEEG